MKGESDAEGGTGCFEWMFESARKDDKLLLPLKVHSCPIKHGHLDHADRKRDKTQFISGLWMSCVEGFLCSCEPIQTFIQTPRAIDGAFVYNDVELQLN